MLPLPYDAKLSWPGCAFACAMRSFTDFASNVGDVSSMNGDVPISMIGAKSLTAS